MGLFLLVKGRGERDFVGRGLRRSGAQVNGFDEWVHAHDDRCAPAACAVPKTSSQTSADLVGDRQ
jgi:hypothetical protein